jgi:DNA-binding CsgD family transcriptional regulator/ArsR family metal-binding transcriptional regulator
MSKEDRFVTGYSRISFKTPGPPLRTAQEDGVWLTADFELDADISPLFPYINAVAESAVYYDKPVFIKFLLDGVLCGLHPESGSAAPFEDKLRAVEFLDRLIAFLNDLHSRKDSIQPNHKKYRPVSVLQILKLLPRTNCGDCGFTSCMAFAAALSKKQTAPEQCPGISRPISENAVYPVYDAQGNLLSTVTIDIDTTKIRHDLQKERESMERLQQRLAAATRPSAGDDKKGRPEPDTVLTGRELEVLRLVASGATNTEISDILTISPHTVKSHVIHIFNKLGVNDRAQAAVWAARNNLI